MTLEASGSDQARLGEIAVETLDGYSELTTPVDVEARLTEDLLVASGPWGPEQIARAIPAIGAAVGRAFRLGQQIGPNGSFFDSLQASAEHGERGWRLGNFGIRSILQKVRALR